MNKKNFPLALKYVFLDNASVTLKPPDMIEAISDFYRNCVSNPRSLDSPFSTITSQKIKETRKLLANFLNAVPEEVIFTSGATQSLKLIAESLQELLTAGEEIILFSDLHTSSIVSWIELKQRKKILLKYVSDAKALKLAISKKTRLIVFPEVNNINGFVHNAKEIYSIAKGFSEEIIVINDAAQAVPHKKVSFQDCDVLFFSAGKFYGPSGLGALFVKKKLLKKLHLARYLSNTIKRVPNYDWQPNPDFLDWEPGTPNTAGIIGWLASLKYILKIGMNKVISEQNKLVSYANKQFFKLKNVKIYSPSNSCIILFSVINRNVHDVVGYLSRKKIIVRSGFHCAPLFHLAKNAQKTIRVSLALYNDEKDIDKLCEAIQKISAEPSKLFFNSQQAVSNRKIILSHFQNPNNFSKTKPDSFYVLPNTTQITPCDDRITLFYKVKKKMYFFKFYGEGCVISIAATDILLDYVNGLKLDLIIKKISKYHMIIKNNLFCDELKELNVFRNTAFYGNRVGCATITSSAIEKFLKKRR